MILFQQRGESHRKGKAQVIGWHKATCPEMRIEGLSKWQREERKAYLFRVGFFIWKTACIYFFSCNQKDKSRCQKG